MAGLCGEAHPAAGTGCAAALSEPIGGAHRLRRADRSARHDGISLSLERSA